MAKIAHFITDHEQAQLSDVILLYAAGIKVCMAVVKGLLVLHNSADYIFSEVFGVILETKFCLSQCRGVRPV